MDSSDRMVLENLQDQIKTLNKNMLYLCRTAARSDSRLENIENVLANRGDRIQLCEKRITEFRSYGVVIMVIITLIIQFVATTIH